MLNLIDLQYEISKMALDKLKSYLFIIFILLSFVTNGQQKEVENLAIISDSLVKPMKAQSCDELFNSYLLKSQFYGENNLESGTCYAEDALDLAISMNENEKIAKAYRNKGLLQLKKNNLVSSKKNIALAETYYYIDKDTTSVALMHLELGDSYYKKADLNQALYNLLLAYDFLKTKEPSDKFVEAVGMIGIVYSDLGMMEKSHEFQTLSLTISEKISSPQMLMVSKNRMGLLLTKENNYVEASRYFEEAIQLGMTDEHFLHELIIAYNGLAYVHFKTGKYGLSLFCSNKSLDILDSQKFPIETVYVYHTMGISYMGLKNYKKSEDYLLNAYNLIAKTPSNAPALIACNKALYELYEKISKPKKALYHYRRFMHIKDSVFGNGVNQKITQLESDRQRITQNKAYNELQLKAENEKLRYNSKLKNIITVGAIIFAGLLCLFLYFFFRSKETKSEAKLQLAQNKFDSLHAQMNPHFIFNVITGVQNFILKAEKYEAYNHLTTFADSIRLIINNASKPFASLEDELALIRVYIDLEKVRFRNDFEYKIDINKVLNISSLLIPTMIVQPIVENAIIHGLSNKRGSGQLSVNFNIRECGQYIICVVVDNGIGRAEAIKIKKNANQEAHLSIATMNAEQRIEILKKMGYKHSQITIIDLIDENQNPAGTEVILCLPIKN